jgi:Uma2 family endonuclease
MSTAIRLKFAPADHGRRVTLDEFEAAEYEPGFKYEIIDGRLFASPQPNAPEQFLETWLRDKLADYGRDRPELAARVCTKARVFVPGRPDLTVPEPELAYYQPYPVDTPIGDLKWEDMTPLVVAEVLVDGNSGKDLVRNVDLYFQVPGIEEYWVLDGREIPGEPLLIARRRYRDRWVLTEVPFGDTYKTATLPGFELVIDPRR